MAVTETVKIVFEVDDKQIVDSVAELAKLGKVSQEDAAKFNALTAASKAAGASLEGASKGAEKFAVASKDVAKSTTEVAKSAGELKTVAPSLGQAGQAAEAAGEGFVSLSKQIKQANLELQQLQESTGGVGPEFDAAKQKVFQLEKQLADLNKEVALTDPKNKAAAFQAFGQSVVGAFQVATGALQAFGVENEKAQEIAQRLQGALNIVQGIESITKLKDTYEDLTKVLGFSSAAQNVLTTATNTGTAATTGAAAATRGFAAALTSTGIGAIVVAIGALVGAFLLYNSSTEEAKANEEALKAAQDASKTSTDNLKDATDRLAVARGQKTQEQVDKENALAASLERQKALNKTLGDAISEQLNAQEKVNELSGGAAPKLREERELRLENAKAAVAQAAGAIQAEKDALAATNAYIDLNKQQKDGADAAANAEREANERKQRRIQLLDEELAALAEAQRGALIGVDDEIQRIAITDSFREQITAKQIERAKVASESITLIEQKAANDQLQSFEDLFAAVEAARDNDVANAEKAAADKLAAQKRALQEEKALVGEQKELELILNQVNATGSEDLAEKNFKTQEKYLKQRIALEEAGSIQQAQLQAQLALLYKDYEEGKTKTAKEAQAERDQIAIDSAQQAFDFILDIQAQSFENETAELEKQREQGLVTEEEYQNKVLELRKRKAIADKNAAIFGATLGLAEAIIKALNAPPPVSFQSVALASALAAANLAKIIATPLPKFKQGTLSVPGYDTGDDSVHAMLRPGEAVIPTETSREYRTSLKAIYKREIDSKELNEFVESKEARDVMKAIYSRKTTAKELKEFIQSRKAVSAIESINDKTRIVKLNTVELEEPVFNFNPVTMDALFKRDLRVSRISSAVDRASGGIMPTINVKADVDTYALGKVISKNKSMEVTNVESIGEAVAEALSKRTNRRQQI